MSFIEIPPSAWTSSSSRAAPRIASSSPRSWSTGAEPVQHPIDLAGLVTAQHRGELHRLDIGARDPEAGSTVAVVARGNGRKLFTTAEHQTGDTEQDDSMRIRTTRYSRINVTTHHSITGKEAADGSTIHHLPTVSASLVSARPGQGIAGAIT